MRITKPSSLVLRVSHLVPNLDCVEFVEGASFAGEDVGGGLGPHVGLGGCIVLQQVVFDRLFQFGDAGERATANAFVRDPGEEALDEVQPGRRCRDEVHLESRMLGEPRLHRRRLVGRVVVDDQVQLDPLPYCTVDLLEEPDELFSPVARLAFADDDAGLHVKCGEQRRRAVAFVIVGHGGGPALFHRQARLRAVERLDLAFLVNAQHHRLVRWVHVEANDVDDFLLELGIVRDLERFDAMRLEAGFAPDASDARRADPDSLCHRCARPMRGVLGCLARRLFQDLELHILRKRRHARGACLVAQQPIDALLDVAFLPAPNARLRLAGQAHDLVGAMAIGSGKHDPRPPNRLVRTVAIIDDRFEPGPVGRAHVKADVIASHAPCLTDLQANGNPLSGGEH
jgi:hypothetical protein